MSLNTYGLTREQAAKCFPPMSTVLGTETGRMENSRLPALTNHIYRKGYVVGRLACLQVPEVAKKLRKELGWEIFDDWQAAHQHADDEWRTYELARGRTYEEALRAPAAQNVFQFDKKHLNECTHGILVLPAGRSGHMEIAYLAGLGTHTTILLDGDYDRWDVMYAFVDLVTRDIDEVIDVWRKS